MSRYIDADKIPYYLRYVIDCQDSDIYKIALAREIAEIPTADVVEVVRCKDCKHGQRNNYGQLKGHYICEYHQDGPLKHRDHYCGHGERRKNGT